MTAKPKAQIMKEGREKKAALGLVRREVWVHKSRSREELENATRKLLKPVKPS